MGEKNSQKLFTISKPTGDDESLNTDSGSDNADDLATIIRDSKQKDSGRLSWLERLAYASVGLPYSMQLSIIAFYINFFLLDVAKVSPIYNAIILFTSRFIDALTDPIGGYIFSRYSFRWGKMKPWILFSSPLVALSYFAIWCLPNISNGGQMVYYLMAHSLFWTFMTASRIPHTALTVYLTVNQQERDQLTKFRTLFEAAGLLLSIGFQWGITSAFKVPSRNIDNCTESGASNNDSSIINSSGIVVDSEVFEVAPNVAAAYMTSAGLVALLCIATSLFLFFTVREVVDVIPTSETSFRKGLSMIMCYRPFLILTVATVASILATQSIQSVLQLYLTHVKEDNSQFIYLASTLIIATMILLFVWSIIMRKIGKKKSFLIGNLCLIPTIIIVLLSDYPIFLLYIAAILGANTVACGYVMPWAMLPECIDAFMLKTQTRPVESFYTFFFLGAKLVQALYAGLVQISLDASGFDAKFCSQSANVKLALRLLMGAVPGVVLVISTVCLYFYSIDEHRAQEIQIQLKELRHGSSPIQTEEKHSFTGINENQATHF